MFSIDCVSPRYLCVHQVGSIKRKDGTPGCYTHFVRTSDLAFLPDENGEIPAVYKVPCGKCLPCRQNQARAWSIRIQMEMKDYKPNEVCFLTLTYDDEHVPDQLTHEHVQMFLHSLRCRLDREYGAKIRFFLCGEYGSKAHTFRPHYHLILFGFDFFEGSKRVGTSKSGAPLFTNPLISDYWNRGYCEFGFMSPGAAMYVAQYQQKKLILRSDYGDFKKPYIQMSRRPGIGSKYIEEHMEKILRDKGVYLNGHFIPIDRYTIRYLFSRNVLSELDRALIRKMYEERALDSDALWCLTHDGDKYETAVWAAQNALEALRASALVKGGL